MKIKIDNAHLAVLESINFELVGDKIESMKEVRQIAWEKVKNGRNFVLEGNSMDMKLYKQCSKETDIILAQLPLIIYLIIHNNGVEVGKEYEIHRESLEIQYQSLMKKIELKYCDCGCYY